MTPEQQIELYLIRIEKLEKAYKELANEKRLLAEHNDALEKKIEGLRNNIRNGIVK